MRPSHPGLPGYWRDVDFSQLGGHQQPRIRISLRTLSAGQHPRNLELSLVVFPERFVTFLQVANSASADWMGMLMRLLCGWGHLKKYLSSWVCAQFGASRNGYDWHLNKINSLTVRLPILPSKRSYKWSGKDVGQKQGYLGPLQSEGNPLSIYKISAVSGKIPRPCILYCIKLTFTYYYRPSCLIPSIHFQSWSQHSTYLWLPSLSPFSSRSARLIIISFVSFPHRSLFKLIYWIFFLLLSPSLSNSRFDNSGQQAYYNLPVSPQPGEFLWEF